MNQHVIMQHSNKNGFAFQSGVHTLRGVSVVPSQQAETAIILIHGWGTCRIGPQRSFVDLADQLASRGFSAFRFDLPGRGESEGDESIITLDDMAQSVVDCIRYIKETYTSIKRFGLTGICSGGNTAILASTEEHVDFLVLWSTFSFRVKKSGAVKTGRTFHFMKTYLKKLFTVSAWKRFFAGALNFKMIFRTLFGHYKRNTLEHLKKSRKDVMDSWKTFKGKALFVYGENDPEAVDAKKEYKEFCAAHSIAAEFADIAQASHNFYRKEWRDELFSVSIDFIEKHPVP
ncbi:alpha/beta fold hydrolase [Planctomycetota bacterium]